MGLVSDYLAKSVNDARLATLMTDQDAFLAEISDARSHLEASISKQIAPHLAVVACMARALAKSQELHLAAVLKIFALASALRDSDGRIAELTSLREQVLKEKASFEEQLSELHNNVDEEEY